MYILFNAIAMALELAAIIAVAWAGFTYPLAFAAATAAIAFLLGMRLEYARLQNEIPFYFDRVPSRAAIFAWAVAGGEAFAKALLAGVVGLLTFLGTDTGRLGWVAGIFAFTLFLGVQIVRVLTVSFKARPLRWGYFRLAAPLGIVFSMGQSFLPAPGFSELARRATFEMPARPTMEQASEFLFLLKQTFDDIVERMLTWVFDPAIAQIAASLVSVNMLSGFVLSIYAVLIAEGIRRMESGNV
ncbi:MAG TPA: hypothetical protein PKD49_09000 [Hyphomicrobium sp.]|nr:hypothetical protein [Hyphomicrobium sp.]